MCRILVEPAMSTEVFTVGLDDRLGDAERVTAEQPVRRVPVVDEVGSAA